MNSTLMGDRYLVQVGGVFVNVTSSTIFVDFDTRHTDFAINNHVDFHNFINSDAWQADVNPTVGVMYEIPGGNVARIIFLWGGTDNKVVIP